MLERATNFPPGIVHGFTTRRGGVSTGGFAALNFGLKWGDEPAAVAENLRLLARRAGFDLETLKRVRQVHGCKVVHAGVVDTGTEADAIWCRREDGPCVVSVMTADCVPVLLVDRGGRIAAAIHSGWRGTVGNVVGRTVEVLVSEGIDVVDLCAAIGPCIEQDAFEVGDEVAARFDDGLVSRGPAGSWPKPHVDLVRAVRRQLSAAGVDDIERVGGCTHADPDRYYSYRRDGTSTGQHLSFVGWA